jgi:hypothetical protein
VATNSGFIIYDPRGLTFLTWAALICEEYAAQNLLAPNEKTDWKDWADGLKGIDIFANEGVPDSRGFDTWENWAYALIGAVNAGR